MAAAACRPNKAFNQINVYTNEGRSEYKAFVSSLTGTLKGGHLVTASFTRRRQEEHQRRLQPGADRLPERPGQHRGRVGPRRAPTNGTGSRRRPCIRLPARFTLAPIFEYGSGQPWNRRYGYDYNGDGKSSDRMAGVAKFSEDGPNFSVDQPARDVRPAARRSRRSADLIAEFFNLFNRVNYDVNSLTVNGAEFLSGPTLQNPAAAVAVREPELQEVHGHAAARSRRSWAFASPSDAMTRYASIVSTGRYLPEIEVSNDAAPEALRAPAGVRRQDGSVQRHPLPLARARRLGDVGRRPARRPPGPRTRRASRPRTWTSSSSAPTRPTTSRPATSVVLQHKLGAKRAGTFDIGCACASFPTGPAPRRPG